MKKQSYRKELAFFLAVVALLAVALFSGLQILESTVFYQGQPQDHYVSKTLEVDGVSYFQRQDITTVLLMGIDRFGPVTHSQSYQNPGATDMNILLIFDQTAQSCTALHLNRDTMVKMPVLGIGGRPAGTDYGQLALAHTYGSGLEDSCENTCATVSNLLGGIPIDYYVSMHMDAIAILNDAVGGVTVEVTEDFSQVDAGIPMGTVKLLGDQAITFVRSRQGVGDQKNTSRIARHEAYVSGFAKAFREAQAQNTEFIFEAYEDVLPYIVTNCSSKAASALISRFEGYSIDRVLTLEGENTVGKQYWEFYPDQEKLDALILELFYSPK